MEISCFQTRRAEAAEESAAADRIVEPSFDNW